MAQIIKPITVDVAKKNLFQAIVAKQNDINSRFLQVSLKNDGEPIEINPSATVLINARRADGESKAFAGSVNADGTVTVPLTNWVLALDDTVRCSISVIDTEGQKLTSTSFTLDVEAAEYAGDDITEDEHYDVLVRLISDSINAKLGCENATADATSATKAANSAAETATGAAAAANKAKASADTATGSANAAAKAAGDAAAAANIATEEATAATENATTAAERAEAAAQAVGDEIDGIVIKDVENSVSYLAKLRLIGGKPAIEYAEL